MFTASSIGPVPRVVVNAFRLTINGAYELAYLFRFVPARHQLVMVVRPANPALGFGRRFRQERRLPMEVPAEARSELASWRNAASRSLRSAFKPFPSPRNSAPATQVGHSHPADRGPRRAKKIPESLPKLGSPKRGWLIYAITV
jgi:hypothetical protein